MARCYSSFKVLVPGILSLLEVPKSSTPSEREEHEYDQSVALQILPETPVSL